MPGLGEFIHRLADPAKGRLELTGQLPPLVRQANPTPLAPHKLATEPVLQRTHLLADGGMTDIQAATGGRQRPLLRDGGERAKCGKRWEMGPVHM